MKIIPLPRFEAWPATESYPAKVRHMWLDGQGRRCTAFLVSCEGATDEEAGVNAALCAGALGSYYGGIVDTSRVYDPLRGAVKGKRKKA